MLANKFSILGVVQGSRWTTWTSLLLLPGNYPLMAVRCDVTWTMQISFLYPWSLTSGRRYTGTVMEFLKMLISAIHPLLNLEWDVVQRTCCTVNMDDMQIASACYPPLAGGKWMTRQVWFGNGGFPRLPRREWRCTSGKYIRVLWYADCAYVCGCCTQI